MQHSSGPGHLLDCPVPVICAGFLPLSPRQHGNKTDLRSVGGTVTSAHYVCCNTHAHLCTSFRAPHTLHRATLAPAPPPGTGSMRIHLSSFDCGTEFTTRQSVLLVATVRFPHALLQNNKPLPHKHNTYLIKLN